MAKRRVREMVRELIARNEKIYTLRQLGWSLRALGREFSLTKERIRQICQLVEEWKSAGDDDEPPQKKEVGAMFEKNREETVFMISRALQEAPKDVVHDVCKFLTDRGLLKDRDGNVLRLSSNQALFPYVHHFEGF